MKEVGISTPWSVVTLEFTTFELQVIDDALRFARDEVEEHDRPPIDGIRRDIAKALNMVERKRSRNVPGFQILRRR